MDASAASIGITCYSFEPATGIGESPPLHSSRRSACPYKGPKGLVPGALEGWAQHDKGHQYRLILCLDDVA